MNLNLIMALVWLAVGVGWLATTWTQGTMTVMSPGGFALLLCVYNLARWLLRPKRRPRQTLEEALDERRRLHGAEERPPATPDPNFIFTDPPPAPEARKPDPPPSVN